MSPSLVCHMRARLALRLACRLALTGPRHEQRQHVVHALEHSGHFSSLIATTIIERMGCTRGCLTQARRARRAGKARQAGTGLARHACRGFLAARLTSSCHQRSALSRAFNIHHWTFVPHASCLTSHLQHAPADLPFLLGSQPHLGQYEKDPFLAGDVSTISTDQRSKL